MDALQNVIVNATGLKNISLLALPVGWVFSILPHFYAISLTKGRFTNASPRGYLADMNAKKTKTPTDLKYIRAEAAQENGFSNLPFFGVALLAGNLARLPASTLNSAAIFYLLTRAVFNVLYIQTTSEQVANLRSIVFLAGVGTCFKLIIQAAYNWQ